MGHTVRKVTASRSSTWPHVADSSSNKFIPFGTSFDVQHADQNYSLTLNPNGTNYQRFEVRAGDQWANDVGGDKERSEIAVLAPLFSEGTDYWISYSVRLGFGDANAGTLFCFGQLHGNGDVGELSPSPAYDCILQTGEDSTLLIRSRTSTTDPLNEVPTPTIHYSYVSFPRFQWVHFLHRYNWDPEGAGIIQTWIDGTQVVDYSGATGYRNVDGPYWKWGIYSSQVDYTRVVEYANMELSTSSLIARASSPLTVYED